MHMQILPAPRHWLRSAAMLALLATLAACGGIVDTPSDEEGASVFPANTAVAGEAPEGILSVADVTGNIAAYAGQTVTVQAEVEEAYGDNALRLDEGTVLEAGIDNDLLAIGPNIAEAIPAGAVWIDRVVQVTGRVGMFDRPALQQELAMPIDDPEFDAWEDRPVMVVESIEFVE
ncbi:MAG: hypothetical protein HC822_25470 [Oscillochloris sp.]|nr:hypothetical protein [Oscillochloris sp.]